ncbi:MAG: topoisomerase C-terminal repeat-containing protein, partial [Acetobacteraceae bacterium]
FGAFIGCSNYPDCPYTRRLAIPGENGDAEEGLTNGIRVLGNDPESGEPITLRRGPYGLYVQQGDQAEKENGRPAAKKPKRVTLPRGLTGESLTLEQALGLLGLPRLIGPHPETGEPITAGIGRFGPFVRIGSVFASLDRDDDVLAIGLNRAVDVLAKKLASLRSIGQHPGDGEDVLVRKGRFGLYVQHGRKVATLPRGTALDAVTLDEAIALLAEKGRTLGRRKESRAGVKAKAKPQSGKARIGAARAAKAQRKSAG